MCNLKFDKRVWQVKAPIAPWKLDLLDAECGKVTKPNNGLRSGDENLCEITDHRCKDKAGENPHVKVKPDSQATDQHEPCSIPSGLFTRGGDHVTEELCVRVSVAKPRMCFREKKIDRCRV